MNQSQRHAESSLFHIVGGQDREDQNSCLAAELRGLAQRLDHFHQFRKGQLVKWKPGLKNRRFPADGEPAIVRDVLIVPVFDPAETSASSQFFAEPLTLVIAIMLDAEFSEYRVDGRRFEPI
jgi:hypothetical protein